MRIDVQSHVPVYLQIVEGVRHAIVRGIYRPGEALPSVRDMGVKLGVNPNTVQRAYEELERAKLVESRRGSGVFVGMGKLQAAREQSVKGVIEAFDGAIATARAADLKRDGVQKLFQISLDKAFGKDGGR